MRRGPLLRSTSLDSTPRPKLPSEPLSTSFKDGMTEACRIQMKVLSCSPEVMAAAQTELERLLWDDSARFLAVQSFRGVQIVPDETVRGPGVRLHVSPEMYEAMKRYTEPRRGTTERGDAV